ncbi:MAG: TIGR03862 family flavoprotein, partial [Pseudorhodoplanes sp.]|nr:TIGR03862 family flavoprotein [Pseudorhodoplanes sp.]
MLAIAVCDWHTACVNSTKQQRAAIIGGGPAGLMAAEILSGAGVAVTLYERMPSLGRKFLIAGRGGLNLTHSEAFERFMARYGEAAPRLREAIAAFSPDDLRSFSEGLGQPTFIGTSGRVFPKDMKSSPFLRAWLRRLDGAGVVWKLRHRWTGWNSAGALTFAGPNGNEVVDTPDATILALGGASWPKFGSDGGWVDILSTENIETSPLRPANCGFAIAWTDIFKQRFVGQPLKRIALSHDGETVRGEAVIAHYGL